MMNIVDRYKQVTDKIKEMELSNPELKKKYEELKQCKDSTK